MVQILERQPTVAAPIFKGKTTTMNLEATDNQQLGKRERERESYMIW